MRYLAVLVVAFLITPVLAGQEPVSAPVDSVASAPSPAGVVERALSFLGVRYRFGSSDERRGFDCSGLVRRAFASVGIDLPGSAAAQYRVGERVDPDELSPGDLVFFRNTYKPGISHVGIYLGENQFVHAASSQRRVVVDDLDSPYYRTRFAGARRLLETDREDDALESGSDLAVLHE